LMFRRADDGRMNHHRLIRDELSSQGVRRGSDARGDDQTFRMQTSRMQTSGEKNITSSLVFQRGLAVIDARRPVVTEK